MALRRFFSIAQAGNPTAAPHEQWPAVFYTQTEMQRLAQDPDAVEDILARLVASETRDIAAREKRLKETDKELNRAARNFAKLFDDVADAEQASQRSQEAAKELAEFEDAGVEKLNRMTSDLSRWRRSAEATAGMESEVDSLLTSLFTADIPDIDDNVASVLEAVGIVEGGEEFRARWNSVRRLLSSAKDELGAANAVTKSIAGALEVHQNTVRVQVDQDLAARGLDGARINQLQQLTSQASLLESHQAHLDEQSDALRHAERDFELLRQERRELVEKQRRAFDRVIEAVHSQFGGRIAARRLDEGRKDTLDRFLRELNRGGITRWWNDLTHEQWPTPDGLLEALDAEQLGTSG